MTNLKEAMEIASIAFESTRQKIEQATREIEMVEQFIQENYIGPHHEMFCFEEVDDQMFSIKWSKDLRPDSRNKEWRLWIIAKSFTSGNEDQKVFVNHLRNARSDIKIKIASHLPKFLMELTTLIKE